MTAIAISPTLLARICALFATALAVLLVAALVADEAGAASSGGISTSSTSAEDTSASPERQRYLRIWDRTSRRERRWARRTAECESGKDPDAIGGGGQYRGAFQFLKSTWRAAPKSPGGDPVRYSYRTQAVVAIALKRRDGAGHWPVCG